MTRVERARRLLTALDDLAGQEAVLLRSLDLVEAIQIAERAAPLVEEVCNLASEIDSPEIRPRLRELIELRRRNASLLETHLSRVQEEIRRVDEARRRISRTAPAYRWSANPSSTYRSNLNTAA